jgi:hypothetical protein
MVNTTILKMIRRIALFGVEQDSLKQQLLETAW